MENFKLKSVLWDMQKKIENYLIPGNNLKMWLIETKLVFYKILKIIIKKPLILHQTGVAHNWLENNFLCKL